MTRTLYITDLDGTLLDSSAGVSDTSRKLLNQAIVGGALFTVATARTPATVDDIMRGVDMRLPGIVVTGAALWDFNLRRYRNIRYIPAASVDTLIDIFDKSSVVPFVYVLDNECDSIMRVYYNSVRPTVPDAKFISARNKLELKRFYIGERVPVECQADVMLFFGSGPRAEIGRVADAIVARTDCSLSCYEDIYNPGTALVEVFAPGVTKGASLDLLRSQTGAERVVVFGDNLNDLGMFGHADIAVAVANALPEVRAAADCVIGANTDDAVAKFILADSQGVG